MYYSVKQMGVDIIFPLLFIIALWVQYFGDEYMKTRFPRCLRLNFMDRQHDILATRIDTIKTLLNIIIVVSCLGILVVYAESITPLLLDIIHFVSNYRIICSFLLYGLLYVLLVISTQFSDNIGICLSLVGMYGFSILVTFSATPKFNDPNQCLINIFSLFFIFPLTLNYKNSFLGLISSIYIKNVINLMFTNIPNSHFSILNIGSVDNMTSSVSIIAIYLYCYISTPYKTTVKIFRWGVYVLGLYDFIINGFFATRYLGLDDNTYFLRQLLMVCVLASIIIVGKIWKLDMFYIVGVICSVIFVPVKFVELLINDIISSTAILIMSLICLLIAGYFRVLSHFNKNKNQNLQPATA